MDAKRLKRVVNDNKRFVSIPDRASVEWMIDFVSDLTSEEIEYLKENEPYATNTIKDGEKCFEFLRSLRWIIDEMETDDIVKEEIWKE